MLDVVNLTDFAHLTFAALDADEQMAEVVVAKGTYALTSQPDASADVSLVPTLSNDGSVLFVTDECFGALNKSSVRTESDLAPFKPRCDLIVIGSAHSPTGKPVDEVVVSVVINRGGKQIHSHSLRVHGERDLVRRNALDRGAAAILWVATAGVVTASEWQLTDAEPFLACPLRYEFAYGGNMRIEADSDASMRVEQSEKLSEGARKNHPDGAEAPIAHKSYRMNPVGRGFLEPWYTKATREDRYAAPRIELATAPFTTDALHAPVEGDPALEPQGFGVITKSWQPRLKLAGTYDETWQKTRWPNPPPDYDMAYWNGAHRLMQCPHLEGGELVTLTNLLPPAMAGTLVSSPRATTARFRLPQPDLALRLAFNEERALNCMMPIDTLIVDLEGMVLHVVWRIRVPAEMPAKETHLVSLTELRALNKTNAELVSSS